MKTKEDLLVETIGSIQYKNRDDWKTIKESIKNLPFEDGDSMMDDSYRLFKNTIKSYMETLMISHLGKETYDEFVEIKKKTNDEILKKEKNNPNYEFYKGYLERHSLTTPFEEKLYNRLYRSLYWGYLIKERIITY